LAVQAQDNPCEGLVLAAARIIYVQQPFRSMAGKWLSALGEVQERSMRFVYAAGVAIVLLAACQTKTGDKTEAKVDPRQGAQVSQVCFSQQIRNWKALDNHSVIVEKGMKDEYKLELVGACEPRDAFTSIGLVSRVGGGSCLQTGDRLVTDSRYDGVCSISRIYEWHADAKAADAAAK
jgi:hypothetical protein